MFAGPFRFEKSGGVSRFEAEVRAEGLKSGAATVRFDFAADVAEPEAVGDAWLAALLVPAMFAGEPLEVSAPVSARLVRTSAELQRMLHSWHPDLLSVVPLITPFIVPTRAERDTGPEAVLFSGGVDSWYSAHQNRGRLEALLTVKGFDIPYDEQRIWAETVNSVRGAAAELGASSITIETNLRDKVDPGLGAMKRRYEGSDFWGASYHGVCLDAIGLFLQESFARVLVPASWQYTRLQPWGSHPLIDALLSNGRVQLVHDGADASRMDKIRTISKLPAAMRLLRACPNFPSGKYNCGVCEKCRRTMMALRALGVDFSNMPFNAALDLRAMELEPPKPYLRPLYMEILNEARTAGDAELVRCLRLLTGETVSFRRGWHRWSTRMKRSVRKRLGLLR